MFGGVSSFLFLFVVCSSYIGLDPVPGAKAGLVVPYQVEGVRKGWLDFGGRVFPGG